MAEDASLDDFAITDEDDEADGDADAEDVVEGDAESGSRAAVDAEPHDADDDTDTDSGSSAADEGQVSVDPSSVEPATTTYGWSSESTACESCGTAVERRWRDGDELVCAECKEW